MMDERRVEREKENASDKQRACESVNSANKKK